MVLPLFKCKRASFMKPAMYIILWLQFLSVQNSLKCGACALIKGAALILGVVLSGFFIIYVAGTMRPLDH